MTTPVTQQDRIEAKLDLLLTLTIASQAKDYSENSPGVIRHVTDDQYKGCLQRLDQMWNEWGDILKPLRFAASEAPRYTTCVTGTGLMSPPMT